ncbi:MAG TPA: hypothetical protein PK668_04715 [Myxococcota bacterium]|nr:hypothetical protein [Myxococcota bacterium]HRY92163.1 hypothetical protein [Myxococcota bacterium]HSA20645.1 hypothetical protein [Myxococcota bacterium]
MGSARVVRWGWLAAGWLVLGCDFSPGLDDHSDAGLYPPCASDQDCLESCVCLGGSVCVPIESGDSCARECDADADCRATAQNAQAICHRGVCELEGCSPPYLDCDGLAENGCESDPDIDPANCGGCVGSGGQACEVSAGEACVLGTCTSAPCPSGWNDCDGDSICESDPLTDGLNCGGCAFEAGEVCEPARLELCDQGVCRVNSCEYDWNDCDDNLLNSCESDPMTDALNCGACLVNGGHLCVPGVEVCADGACVCAEGFADCNGEGSCEPLGTPTACLGCEDDCTTLDSVDPAGVGCDAGRCVIFACLGFYADCDGDPEDGCEAYLLDDAENCGACGHICTPANVSSAVCFLGECNYDGGCLLGFDDCDGDRRNGCEADLAQDPQNCHFCGNECSNGQVCGPNECDVSTCPAAMADCDGDGSCETTLRTLTDCSFCNDNCWLSPAYLDCDGGMCYPVCAADQGCTVSPCGGGLLECDGIVGEQGQACETSMSDLQCGSCAHDCWQDPAFWAGVYEFTIYPICAVADGGRCAPATCQQLRAECDRLSAEVCETHLDWVTDCGQCGVSCLMYSTPACLQDGSCTMICEDAVCRPFTCPPGRVDCIFEDNVLCETEVTPEFDCLACDGRCPSGEICLDGECKPRDTVVCDGLTCAPGEVCCLGNDMAHSLQCVDPVVADNCLVTLSCTGPADCPQGQACCESSVGGLDRSVACRPAMECSATGILCGEDLDCAGDLGVVTYCCPNPLLPGFSTCQLTPCDTTWP